MRLTIIFYETTFREQVTEILRKLLPDEPNVESIHQVGPEGVNVATYNLPWSKDQDLFVGVFPEGTPVRFISERTHREWRQKFPDARQIQQTQTIPSLEEMNPIRHPDKVIRTVGTMVTAALYVTFSQTFEKDIAELLSGYPDNWFVLTDHTDGKLGETFHEHAEEYNSAPGALH